MKRELKLLNLVCVVVALIFLGFAAMNVIMSPQLFTTDNLFVISVCLVMALMFGVIPLFQMHSEGRLPIPFQKRIARRAAAKQVAAGAAPPLLDAKGRAIPPDVSSIVARMNQKQP